MTDNIQELTKAIENGDRTATYSHVQNLSLAECREALQQAKACNAQRRESDPSLPVVYFQDEVQVKTERTESPKINGVGDYFKSLFGPVSVKETAVEERLEIGSIANQGYFQRLLGGGSESIFEYKLPTGERMSAAHRDIRN